MVSRPAHFVLLPCVLALSAGLVRCQSDCSDAQRARNVDEHQKCVQLVQSRFQTFGANLCDQMHEQINKCSRIFDECETKEDIRVMKDAQIEIMLKLLGQRGLAHLIEECEVVDEYVRSGRVPHKATDLCEATEVKHIVETQQRCISREKSGMEGEIRKLNVRSRNAVHRLICNFIDKSLHECSSHLEKCYNEEEISDIKNASVQIIEKVLDLMGSNFEVDRCSTLSPSFSPLSSSSSREAAAPSSFLSMTLGFIAVFITSRRNTAQ